MLSAVESPMPVSLQFALLKSGPAAVRVVRRAFWGVLVGFVACIPWAHAQNPAAAPLPSAPEAAVAQRHTSVPATAATANSRTAWQWNQPPVDPFQPNLAIGNDSRVFSAGLEAGSARGFNPGHIGQVGFNPLGGRGAGDWQGGVSMRDSTILLGPELSSPPSLNQLMRGSWNKPLDASAGTSRLSFRAPLMPGATFGDLAHPPMTGLYSTTDLGNGMFLSAGTSFGHSNAGAPAAVMGANAAGAKHLGPSLGVKLSF